MPLPNTSFHPCKLYARCTLRRLTGEVWCLTPRKLVECHEEAADAARREMEANTDVREPR